jgi:CRP/FNR family cyclic AMP-dependent transcriptional regulator
MPSFEIFSREPDVRSFGSGAPIFREGDPGDCMFVILEGTVEIHSNGAVVDRLGAGEIFGEMALIDSRPRSAAAIAATECKLAAIGEKRFLRLIEQTPKFALQIMRVMTERLRRSSGH